MILQRSKVQHFSYYCEPLTMKNHEPAASAKSSIAEFLTLSAGHAALQIPLNQQGLWYHTGYPMIKHLLL